MERLELLINYSDKMNKTRAEKEIPGERFMSKEKEETKRTFRSKKLGKSQCKIKEDVTSFIKVDNKDHKEIATNSNKGNSLKLDSDKHENESFVTVIQVKKEVIENFELNEPIELLSEEIKYEVHCDEINVEGTSGNQGNHEEETSVGSIERKEKSLALFKCEYEGCGKEFSQNYVRKKHIDAVHLNIRKFHCEYCGNSFKTSSAIKVHIAALHTKAVDKEQYECDICKKIFYRKAGLQLHLATHTDVKSFVCSFDGCGKAFKQRTNLTKHKKTHDEKPYDCRLCDERFSRKIYLDTHMYKHTGMKNYMCDICQKTFSQKGNMVTHKLLHSQDRPVFKCPQCSKAFNFKSNLKKHLEKHVNEKS